MILPLEQQVCSLESAKRLKELGFDQESLFYWSVTFRPDEIKENDKRIVDRKQYFIEDAMKKDIVTLVGYHYSAYTVAELEDMLPQGFYSYLAKMLIYRLNKG